MRQWDRLALVVKHLAAEILETDVGTNRHLDYIGSGRKIVQYGLLAAAVGEEGCGLADVCPANVVADMDLDELFHGGDMGGVVVTCWLWCFTRCIRPVGREGEVVVADDGLDWRHKGLVRPRFHRVHLLFVSANVQAPRP